MDIVNPAIEAYALGLVPPRDAALAAIERSADEKHLPIVEPLEGHFLHLLARVAKARTVLELGTCNGYSATWLGRAVAPLRGSVLTIEFDPARAEDSRRNIASAGLSDIVTVRQGDALDILAGLTDQYDLVFNDLLRSFRDEARMRRLFDLTTARVRPGGLLISDNALHGGDVIDPGDRPGPRAIALHNQLLVAHPDFITSMVPMRDGVALSYRVG